MMLIYTLYFEAEIMIHESLGQAN